LVSASNLVADLSRKLFSTAARERGHGLRANKNSAEFCVTRVGKNVQIRDYA
jgi:hypothetical protein